MRQGREITSAPDHDAFAALEKKSPNHTTRFTYLVSSLTIQAVKTVPQSLGRVGRLSSYQQLIPAPVQGTFWMDMTPKSKKAS